VRSREKKGKFHESELGPKNLIRLRGDTGKSVHPDSRSLKGGGRKEGKSSGDRDITGGVKKDPNWRGIHSPLRCDESKKVKRFKKYRKKKPREVVGENVSRPRKAIGREKKTSLVVQKNGRPMEIKAG